MELLKDGKGINTNMESERYKNSQTMKINKIRINTKMKSKNRNKL